MQVPDNLTKLYYTIGEVAKMFDVSHSLIRYWESEFKTLKPQKTSRGDRKFTKKEIEELARIYTLVKERGFTIEGAKKELSINPKPESEKPQIKEQLVRIKDGLTELREKLSKSM
jgi:DNA-binding transcriptional MerR regulator